MQTNHTCQKQTKRPRAASLRLLLSCLLFALFSIISLGCRSSKHYDGIEAELRTRERELADTRAALDQSRNLLRAYEAAQQRGTPCPQTGGPYLPLKEIVIGRGTGGLDEDGAPGDEGLMVVIIPRDEDGSAVKVPGRAIVTAWEITPAGLKNPIGSWEIPADHLRRTWKSGLISTGYFVALPWQTTPSTDRVRVAVRLIASDNRAYEADRDVGVRPPLPPNPNILPYPQPTPQPGNRLPVFPERPPPGVPSVIPPGVEELPPPAPLDRGARLLPPG